MIPQTTSPANSQIARMLAKCPRIETLSQCTEFMSALMDDACIGLVPMALASRVTRTISLLIAAHRRSLKATVTEGSPFSEQVAECQERLASVVNDLRKELGLTDSCQS